MVKIDEMTEASMGGLRKLGVSSKGSYYLEFREDEDYYYQRADSITDYEKFGDQHLLRSIGDFIKKSHYLPFVKKTNGIEDTFYRDFINYGYRLNPQRVERGVPDFDEFEVKGITSTGMRTWIEEGFEQHDNKVVAIIAANDQNLKVLEEMKNEYDVLVGEIIHFPKGDGYSNAWVGAIFNKK